MSLNVQHLSDLTQDQVDQAYNLIVQMVQEGYPAVDLKRGVIRDLVIYLSSILSAANSANIATIRESNSLAAIQANPTLADPDIVATVASNYLTAPLPGTVATGPVAIIINSQVEVFIPLGAKFTTTTGLIFTADNSYTSRINSNEVVSSTDRLMTALGNGTYIFTINVVSAAVGSTYKLTQNTNLILPSLSPNLISGYSAADFIGGADVETITALSKRLAAGVSSKSLCNRTSIDGLIRALNLPMYDASLATSTVGYGDGEQLRYHSIFPVAFGGRADVYVRTQATTQLQEVIKQATYTGHNSFNQGIWRIVFGRDEVPGLYEVTRVQQLVNIDNDAFASYVINSDTRNFDLSTGSTPSTTFLPDIVNPVEAAYSRYQTVTVTFTDTDTSISGLVVNTSTANYGVQLLALPGLAAIQDAVSDRNTRYPIGDCLIKAPIPCYVSLAVTINKRTVDSPPDTTAIAKAAANTVNTIGFTGRIAAATITSAIQSVISANMAVANITIQGRIRRADGVIINLSSSTVLDVGNDTSNLVTPRTIGFFLNQSDVAITIANID